MSCKDEENSDESMTSIVQHGNKENDQSKPNQNINIPKTPVSLLQVCLNGLKYNRSLHYTCIEQIPALSR